MRHWQLNYTNRKKELDFVNKNLLESYERNAVYFTANAATGFSRFCNTVGMAAEKQNHFPIYLDGANQSGFNIYQSTFEKLYEIDKSTFHSVLGVTSAKEPGSGFSKGLSALANLFIPGGLLSEEFRAHSENIKAIRQNGYLQERYVEFLLNYSRNKPVLFLIDNVQQLDKWSQDVIETLEYCQANVKYLIGSINRTEENKSQVLTDKLAAKGHSIHPMFFIQPDTTFTQELFTGHGKKITSGQAESIVYECDGNIYRIIGRLNGTDEANNSSISEIEKCILKLLLLAEQPVRKSDIITIINGLPDFSLVNQVKIENAINAQISNGNLFALQYPDGDTLIKLSSTSLADSFLKADSLVNQLLFCNKLYEFYLSAWQYSFRHSKSEIALLLFRLAQKVSPENLKKHAADVINLSFSLGTFNRAKEYVSKIVDVEMPSSEAEYYTSISFNLASRNYSSAFALLKSDIYSKWNSSLFYDIARGICLERNRDYENFEALLSKLLPVANVHEEGILRIHQINMLVHQNKLDEAEKIFRYCDDNLRDSMAYPYLLRSATSIFTPFFSSEYLNKALNIFENGDDSFGFATTLANKGLLHVEATEYKEALKCLGKSKEILQAFGIHHLNIVYNNLGLAYLNQMLYEQAKQCFIKSEELSNGEMSRFYASMNLAILECLNNQGDKALLRIQRYENWVKEYTVDRVRQKFFANIPPILILTNAPKQEIVQAIKEMRAYPDRKQPQKTKELTDKLSAVINKPDAAELKIDISFFSQCYLEYWYSNPLGDLPSTSLPDKAFV